MPKRISFRAINVTSEYLILLCSRIRFFYILAEEVKFKLSELNTHGPTVRGWRSEKNCDYPQEIILNLERRCILNKIQILVHQYLIRMYYTITYSENIQFK